MRDSLLLPAPPYLPLLHGQPFLLLLRRGRHRLLWVGLLYAEGGGSTREGQPRRVPSSSPTPRGCPPGRGLPGAYTAQVAHGWRTEAPMLPSPQVAAPWGPARPGRGRGGSGDVTRAPVTQGPAGVQAPRCQIRGGAAALLLRAGPGLCWSQVPRLSFPEGVSGPARPTGPRVRSSHGAEGGSVSLAAPWPPTPGHGILPQCGGGALLFWGSHRRVEGSSWPRART